MNRATHSDSWVQNPDGTPGYTCSLITGCLLGHDYCFARKLANGRLKKRYLANKELAPVHYDTYKRFDGEVSQAVVSRAFDDPFYPRFWPDRLKELDRFLTRSKKPLGVFLNIMGEWAGDWVPREWQDAMFELINRHPSHRFYLLTHCPQNLPQFSPFPDHCYVGVTVTGENPKLSNLFNALDALDDIQCGMRFLSFEPLLKDFHITDLDIILGGTIDWIIIGALTGSDSALAELSLEFPHLTPMPYGKRWTLQPKIEWVEEIIKAADKAGIPVFLKDNLEPLWTLKNSREPFFKFSRPSPGATNIGRLRQEMPG